MDATSPTERFAALVGADDPPLDLGAALIAAHAGDVDPDALVERLDRIALDVVDPGLDGLLAWFRAAGFEGDRVTYADPANSYLDQVLDRRLGIPISLSVVLIEVGRRVDVPLVGVSMPGHFLVRDADPDGDFVDAFDGGRRFDAAGARELFAQLHGTDTGFHPAHLAPVGPVDILTRMLTNLRLAFTRTQDLRELTWVLRLRTFLPSVGPDERSALASVLASQGRYLDAASELEELAELVAGDPDRSARHRHQARQLRAKLN